MQTNNVVPTPDLARLIQKSKAVIAHQGNPGAPAQSTQGTALNEEKEIPASLLHVDLNAIAQATRPVGPKPVNTDAIQAILEGRGTQVAKSVDKPVAIVPAFDPVKESDRIFESVQTQPKKEVAPVAAPVSNKKELLKEVVVNLRSGGLLKEEIVRIVEASLTEETIVPLLEKHFDKLMRNFLSKNKKA